VIHHFPHRDPDTGDWHAVYQIPGTTQYTSVGGSLTRYGAAVMASEANAEQLRQHLASMAAAKARAAPRIAAGFYTDEDAR